MQAEIDYQYDMLQEWITFNKDKDDLYRQHYIDSFVDYFNFVQEKIMSFNNSTGDGYDAHVGSTEYNDWQIWAWMSSEGTPSLR